MIVLIDNYDFFCYDTPPGKDLIIMKYFLVLELRPNDFMPVDINLLIENNDMIDFNELYKLANDKEYGTRWFEKRIAESRVSKNSPLND